MSRSICHWVGLGHSDGLLLPFFYSSFGPRPFLVECFHCLLCPPILRQHLIFVMLKYLMIGVVVVITLAISRLQPIRRPIEINQHICCFIISQHFSTSCHRKPYFPVNNKISQLSQLGGADTQISNVFSELKTRDFSTLLNGKPLTKILFSDDLCQYKNILSWWGAKISMLLLDVC